MGFLAVFLMACSSAPPPEPPADASVVTDTVLADLADLSAPDAVVSDEDVIVAPDLPPDDVERICPVVARAGEVCGALEGLHCTGTRVCTPCSAFAYEYFEQECVCMRGTWQCGGHGDCGPSARCGYFSDAVCTQPYGCGADASVADTGS